MHHVHDVCDVKFLRQFLPNRIKSAGEGRRGEERGEPEAGPDHGAAQGPHTQDPGDPGQNRVLLEVLQVIPRGPKKGKFAY